MTKGGANFERVGHTSHFCTQPIDLGQVRGSATYEVSTVGGGLVVCCDQNSVPRACQKTNV